MAKARRHLTITNLWYATDGGTVALSVVDADGTIHWITLVQHVSRTYREDDLIPGRLYFDEHCLEIRSAEERSLLAQLQEADIQLDLQPLEGEPISEHRVVLGDDLQAVFDRSPLATIRAAIKGIVGFVASDEYLAFAKTVNLR